MKKVKKAVIPVAGMGTRFLPITKGVSKELLPVVDKPSLQYIIEECVESGIEEIYLIVSDLKPDIKSYFSSNKKLEKFLKKREKFEQLELVKNISKLCKINYITQKEPLGSGHAVNLAYEYVKNEPFAVLYGDDLMSYKYPVLKQLIDVYEKYDCNVIGTHEIDKNLISRYGIMEFDNKTTGKIRRIVEKPKLEEAPSNVAGLGRYILKPEIFKELNKIRLVNHEYQLTDAMTNLMNYQDFYACNFNGKYYDIGNKLGYLKANIEFGLEREDIKKELKAYLDNKFKY